MHMNCVQRAKLRPAQPCDTSIEILFPVRECRYPRVNDLRDDLFAWCGVSRSKEWMPEPGRIGQILHLRRRVEICSDDVLMVARRIPRPGRNDQQFRQTVGDEHMSSDAITDVVCQLTFSAHYWYAYLTDEITRGRRFLNAKNGRQQNFHRCK